MPEHKLADVWTSRDYPILKAVTLAVDQHGMPAIGKIAKATGLDPADVDLGLLALQRRGLVRLKCAASGRPYLVLDVSGDAYLITGLHPDGNDALEALASILRQAADRTVDPEEKSRLRKAASAVGDLVGQVGAGVMTAYLAHLGGFA